MRCWSGQNGNRGKKVARSTFSEDMQGTSMEHLHATASAGIAGAANSENAGDVLPVLALVQHFVGMFKLFGVQLRLAPDFHASAFAAFTPARVRPLRRLRSSSASTPINLPHGAACRSVGVDVLSQGTEFHASVCLRSSSMVIRSRRLRPSRSSFYAISRVAGFEFLHATEKGRARRGRA